jgi:hypothetical protein
MLHPAMKNTALNIVRIKKSMLDVRKEYGLESWLEKLIQSNLLP